MVRGWSGTAAEQLTLTGPTPDLPAGDTRCMNVNITCPVCGAEPGQPCLTTLGRPCRDHAGRTRRANRPQALDAGVSLTARVGDRKRLLAEELGKARLQYVQLAFVIDYLEKELSE